jgi:cytochrome c-type biogenesis protein
MTEAGLAGVVGLPILLGLFGFIEPCSIGSTLVMVKQMEGQPRKARIVQVITFAGARAVFIGVLGAVAAAVGSVFLGFQKAAWVVLGVLYLTLGLLYLGGRAGALMRGFAPSLLRLRSTHGAFGLGLVFGLNIPACAAPLLLALLGLAAAEGVSGSALGTGFVSLALFGLALSLPLVVAMFIAAARSMLDRLAALSGRIPRWTGVLFVLLGLWSIWFGLFVSITA